MENFNQRNVVKVSHELNHFRGGYTPLELDFIYSFIACIKNEDEEFKEYRLSLDELETKMNKRLKLARVEKIFDSLITKSFKVHTDKKLTVYSFFSKMEFDKEAKEISVKFNEELKPHLLKLQTYAMGNFRYILSFRSEYSKRLYMLLAQWRRAGEVAYTVEQLREMLAIPKSYNYSMFKKRAIERSLKEFKDKSSFTFEFEEIKKRGKAVYAIRFIIKTNDKELNEFQELIKEDYHDLKLLEFDGKMTYCDEEGRLYYVIVDPLKETIERKYHPEEYAKSCWKKLFKMRDKLPIFTNPTLLNFDPTLYD